MTTFYLTTPQGDSLYAIFLDHNVTIPGAVKTWRANNKYGVLVRTEQPVDEISYTTMRYERTGTYVLRDPAMESAALPLTCTADERAHMNEDLADFYTANTIMFKDVHVVDVRDHVAITGDMPPLIVPNNWKPSAWAEIYGPAFNHQVSGMLTGLRATAIELANTYGTCYDRDGERSPLKVGVRSFYSPPRTRQEKRLRKFVNIETWTTHELKFDIPASVSGTNLADAQAQWNRILGDMKATLEEFITCRTCSACDGRGFIPGAS